MRSLSTRLIVLFCLLQLALLPALGYVLTLVIERNLNDAFITHVRTYTRLLADAIEHEQLNLDASHVNAFLDAALLGGGAVAAEFSLNGVRYTSELNELELPGEQDFRVGQHGDGVYVVSSTVSLVDREGTLAIGFDETRLGADIRDAERRIASLLGTFLLVSLAILFLFSRWINRPLSQLARRSRQVADGNWEQQLQADSGIAEIDALAEDLEHMRHRLVSTNQSLQQEANRRQLEVEKRAEVETQLRHAQKIESIGTLAGGMAHEFNNLLHPMLMNIELLMEDLADNRQAQRDLEKVLHSIRRARALISRILEFSRQTGVENLQPIDVNQVVDDSIGWLRSLIPASVSIRTDTQGELTVLMDASQLHQVLVNLCNNAVEAMRSSGGVLSIRTRRAGAHVVIEVEDTGEGMSQELQSRIFEPFFTTRSVGTGTGLGLSVVHGIVTASGGSIEVHSARGQGARMIVYLPAYDSHSDAATAS